MFTENLRFGVTAIIRNNPQSWTKGWRQIDEIKQNRFFYGMFTAGTAFSPKFILDTKVQNSIF